jgi:hypothetical protein
MRRAAGRARPRSDGGRRWDVNAHVMSTQLTWFIAVCSLAAASILLAKRCWLAAGACVAISGLASANLSLHIEDRGFNDLVAFAVTLPMASAFWSSGPKKELSRTAFISPGSFRILSVAMFLCACVSFVNIVTTVFTVFR